MWKGRSHPLLYPQLHLLWRLHMKKPWRHQKSHHHNWPWLVTNKGGFAVGMKSLKNPKKGDHGDSADISLFYKQYRSSWNNWLDRAFKFCKWGSSLKAIMTSEDTIRQECLNLTWDYMDRNIGVPYLSVMNRTLNQARPFHPLFPR